MCLVLSPTRQTNWHISSYFIILTYAILNLQHNNSHSMIYLLKISQQKLFLGIHPINNYNTKEVYSTDSKFEHLLTSQFEVKKLGPKSLLDEKIKIPWSGPRFQIIHWSSLVSFETFCRLSVLWIFWCVSVCVLIVPVFVC